MAADKPVRGLDDDEPVIVRSAAFGDASAVRGLLAQLGYPLPLESIEAKLERAAAERFDGIFVAEQRDRVVGCIGVHAHDLLHLEGRLGRIIALVVDETARGRGIDAALMAAAERALDASGCVKIEVTSGDHRADAHRFYEAQGFRRDERRFLKVLDMGRSSRRD